MRHDNMLEFYVWSPLIICSYVSVGLKLKVLYTYIHVYISSNEEESFNYLTKFHGRQKVANINVQYTITQRD